MTDLPPGFSLDQQASTQQANNGLPAGFVVDNSQEVPKKKFGLEDTWPAKLAKSIYSAVTLPGDVYQGKVQMWGDDGHTNPEVIDRAFDLASIASPASVASTATSAAKGAAMATAKREVPTIEELKASATRGYESPEVKALEVKPTVIKNFGQAAETALTNEGFDPTLADKTFTMLRNLQRVPDESVITGNNINTLRKMFGKAAQSSDKTEAAAASKVINFLDDALTKVPSSEVVSGDLPAAASRLEAARGDYSAAMNAEKIDNKTLQAEIRAAASNSGMNVANTIRQRMADVVLKQKEAQGLLPDEIAAAKQISEGTRVQNAMRAAGNMMGGGLGLGGATIGAIGAMTTPGGLGALVPVAGAALKGLSNKMTLKQAEKLSEMIRSRAPLASSNAKFNQAVESVQANRTPQTIAGVVLAARNLATNMRSSGFNVSASDLLSELQGPKESGAQNE